MSPANLLRKILNEKSNNLRASLKTVMKIPSHNRHLERNAPRRPRPHTATVRACPQVPPVFVQSSIPAALVPKPPIPTTPS